MTQSNFNIFTTGENTLLPKQNSGTVQEPGSNKELFEVNVIKDN